MASLGPTSIGTRVVVRYVLPGRSGPTGGPAMTDVLGVLEEWGTTSVVVRTESGDRVVIDRAAIVAGKPVPPRPSVRLRATVEETELRAMDSWPPLEREQLGDWVLRASAGFSSRGNSTLVLGDPGRPWREALSAVTDFYAARGIPALAHAVSGSEAEQLLTEAGWVDGRRGAPTVQFQVAGVAASRRSLARPGSGGGPPVVVASRVSDAWLADDSRALAHRDAALAVLEGPDQVGFAAVAAASGTVLAKGRAALSVRADVWVGISDLWVTPDHRREGLALAVLDALLGWAAELGATAAYLQCRSDNAAALALYERAGFLPHHTYRYLTPPHRG